MDYLNKHTVIGQTERLVKEINLNLIEKFRNIIRARLLMNLNDNYNEVKIVRKQDKIIKWKRQTKKLSHKCIIHLPNRLIP